MVDGAWIARRENLLVTDPTGPRLFEVLAIARGDGRHARMLTLLARTELLILDDRGWLS